MSQTKVDEYANPDALVTTDWLVDNLDDPELRIIEVDEDTESYGRSHIPGAFAWNWSTDLHHPLLRDYLDQDGFSRRLAESGVDENTTVVFYGGNNNWFAAYAYWLLKLRGFDSVKRLDGGRLKWNVENRPTTTDIPNPQTTGFRLPGSERPQIRALRDEVLELAAHNGSSFVDVRSHEEYAGIKLASHWPVSPLSGLVAFLMLALFACTSGTSTENAASGSTAAGGAPEEGVELVYATGKDITCIDPHVGGDMPQASIAAQYLDSIVSQDREGNIHPWLATEWEVSDDGLTWTFHLRDDVVFTDGTPFNSEAVKANLDHMVDPATQSGTAGGYLKPYVSTEVVDDTTAVVTLNRPYAAFLEVLAQPFLGIQSPTALARSLEENCGSPVGSGPFKVVSSTPQQEVVLERNETYNSAPPFAEHTGPAKVEKITWRIIPENATRYGGIRTGEIDVIDFLPPENFAEAEDDDRVTLNLNDRPGNPTSLAFNVTRPPFDDINVRKAFLLASDVRNGVESIFLGTSTYAGGPLSHPTPFYSPDFEDVYAYDLDQANQLLDVAGWTERDSEGYRIKDGKRLTLELPITPAEWPASYNALITQIQAKVKDAGFHLDIQNVDGGTGFERNSTFDYDLRAQYWNTNTADVLRIVFATEYLVSAGWVPNGSGYSNPELDDLLNQALATTEPSEREELYYRAQRIISGDALQLTLYAQSTQIASRNDQVQNVVVEPSLSLPYLYDAWVVSGG